MGRTDRLVSLYFTLMSAAVSRIASIASSSVTLYTFWLAIDNCAAVTALTAAQTQSALAFTYSSSGLAAERTSKTVPLLGYSCRQRTPVNIRNNGDALYKALAPDRRWDRTSGLGYALLADFQGQTGEGNTVSITSSMYCAGGNALTYANLGGL